MPLRVQYGPFDVAGDLASLERDWRDLESRATTSFFRCWEWIGSWLEAVGPKAELRIVRVSDDARTVGLAVLGRRRTTRRRVIRSTRLHLSETGDPALDTLTVEHNGLLAERGRESEVVRRALATLADGGDDWDEILVAGVEAAEAPAYVSAGADAGLIPAVDWEKPYFFADLAKVRDAGGDLLATVSGNTRYQVRRALRDYAGDGEVRLVAASSTEEALLQFARMKELHQSTWAARGQPGAFATAFAVDFHERLIRRAFPRGRVELLRVDAGDRPIGYLYNFVHDGTASNYQSGLAYEDDAKRKPGLVAHYLAVQRCVEAGLRRYDFLMGDRRYKRSLATDEGSMAWITLQRPRLRFRAENALRTVKRRATGDEPA